MVIHIKNLRVKTFGQGFRLDKQKGKTQWTNLGYYGTLPEVFDAMFDKLLTSKNNEITIDTGSINSIHEGFSHVIEIVLDSKNEILQVLTSLKEENKNED